jgi:hypothetical protein
MTVDLHEWDIPSRQKNNRYIHCVNHLMKKSLKSEPKSLSTPAMPADLLQDPDHIDYSDIENKYARVSPPDRRTHRRPDTMSNMMRVSITCSW